VSRRNENMEAYYKNDTTRRLFEVEKVHFQLAFELSPSVFNRQTLDYRFDNQAFVVL
jgi:hypothetical protein